MRTTILAMLLLLAPIILLSGCGSLSEAEKYYEAGLNLQKQGEMPEAIAEYDKAIELNPGAPNGYVIRGLAYSSLGQF